jgi:hypothetical protein
MDDDDESMGDDQDNRMTTGSPALDSAAWGRMNRAAPDDKFGSPVSQLNLARIPIPAVPPMLFEEEVEEDASAHSSHGEPTEEDFSAESSQQPAEESMAVDPTTFVEELTTDPTPEVHLPGKTVRQKLKSCMEAMRKTADDEMIVAGDLALSLDQIQKFFHEIIQSKGRLGAKRSPPILHVCGAPGSGKSMGVRKCSENAQEWHKQNSEEWESAPRICHINASLLQNHSKNEAMKKTLQVMNISKLRLKRPADESKASAVILIIDEIDLLVNKTPLTAPFSGTENYLQTLLGWASDEDMLLSIIGISNSVENIKARRMKTLGLVRLFCARRRRYLVCATPFSPPHFYSYRAVHGKQGCFYYLRQK